MAQIASTVYDLGCFTVGWKAFFLACAGDAALAYCCGGGGTIVQQIHENGILNHFYSYKANLLLVLSDFQFGDPVLSFVLVDEVHLGVIRAAPVVRPGR